MIYKLIILTASLLFIWEFMKVRSTAVAQVEPRLSNIITSNPNWQHDDLLLIANNEQSFKNWVSKNFNMAKRGSFFNANGVLDAVIVDLIQKNDTLYFQWRNSINNPYLALNGA